MIDMKIKKIIPAIIAKTQKELAERIRLVEDFVDLIQLDIMDGKFVPNDSINFNFELPKINSFFEAHLMIEKPEKWIEKNYRKADTFLVHYESCYDPSEIIKLVKNNNKRVGFVLNPETSIDKIEKYIYKIDQVLIMTVKPGFYGSPFLHEMLDKISDLRKKSPDLDIDVDGGITDKTIGLVNKAGANMFVSGSYIVKSKNVENAIDSLKKIVM